LSSEEWRRREGEPSREESPREEFREETQESGQGTDGVSGPVEAGEPEDVGVSPEADDADALMENLAEEQSGEVLPDEKDTLSEAAISEEPVEITQDEISTLADGLETARRERDEYLDSMRRMKAELENSRKRQEKERTRLVQLASERLVRELLPVLDNLERALEVEGNIREGVEATREQFLAVLEGEGLTPVASDGESFDPALHEAVMGQPSEEHDEDTVIMTLERGYVLNGKPIRPAKVIVAK
jgi:molecular chaperone GrpE